MRLASPRRCSPAPTRAAIRTATPRRTRSTPPRPRPRRPRRVGGTRHDDGWRTTPIRPGLASRTIATTSRATWLSPGRRLRLELEVGDALLQGVDRLRLALGGGLDERSDLVGEEVGIAAAHDRTSAPPPSCRAACRRGRRRSSAPCPPPSTPAAEWCASGCAARRRACADRRPVPPRRAATEAP